MLKDQSKKLTIWQECMISKIHIMYYLILFPSFIFSQNDWKVPIIISTNDWQATLFFGAHSNGTDSFDADLDSISPDFFLNPGDPPVNGIELQVIHTPGHSPGSVSLYLPSQKVLFTGDLIFNDAVGRTDLAGGDGKLLKDSIRRISNLEVEWLLPGHEDIVSGAREIKENFRQIEEFWFKFI